MSSSWLRLLGILLLPSGIVLPVQTQAIQQAVTIPGESNPHIEIATSGQQTFVFDKDVEEVVLHTSVSDEKHRLVKDLGAGDFTVLENGVPQQLKSLAYEDMPVAMGIVIDSSASMLGKSLAVNQAALNLVRTSNPNDEIFVAHFDEQYHLDQDFTPDISKLQTALGRIRFQGQTAIYDAIVAAVKHLYENQSINKKVLVIVTDGEDNYSNHSLAEAIESVQLNGGPVIYTIGIFEQGNKNAERALTDLAAATGGVVYLPHNAKDVNAISHEVSDDVRNQYTITYKPSISWNKAGYRRVKVQVKAHGHKKLIVRTRSGYFADAERASR
jgi:Ca-activated chloride channel family protein